MFNYDRMDELFRETGKKKGAVLNALNKPTYYFTNCLKTSKDLPDEEVEIIAAELGTTAAYLRGETDEKTPPAEPGAEKLIYAMLNDMSAKELLELSEYIMKLAKEKMEK